MRNVLNLFIVTALSTAFAAIPAAQSSKDKKKQPKIIELSGCVERDERSPQQFVIKDAHEGSSRLSGKGFREYLGRSVTVDGGVVVKGLTVKGGLTPTPNIAAQA